ncbi:SurA N-terminal domain-containing protein [Streptomyces sp. 6N223]|uniref:SurA N-terminal domain-containing protein n=1 Tax=Streptomyces sp. 6N223 TaxID=3457412 RepID=UPI003FD4683F
MKRRSSRTRRSRSRNAALSVSAAALLASVPLLSGCSTDAHPGAAAVVGEQRISLSEVQSQVETVRDAQRELPEADDLIARSNTLTRETVAFLVRMEVVEQAAAEQGVEVTRRDVQQARQQAEASVGGAEELRQSALVPAQGMPLAGEQIDMVLRSNLLISGIAEAIGAGADPEGQMRVTRLLTDTAEEIGVDINPRYGEWDAQAFSLTENELPWLRVTEDTAA